MQNFLNEQIKKNPDFNLIEWLRKKAGNASKLTLCTHPIKISHPDAKGTSILFEDTVWENAYQSGEDNNNEDIRVPNENKYLRSGTVKYQDDILDCAVGNAADIPIYKFLMDKMEDNRFVLTHLEERTESIKNALKCQDEQEFEEIRSKLLLVKKDNDQLETDHRVKQVYFPVNDGSEYHLLSILSPTKIMLELKNRVKKINEESKKINEKNKKVNEKSEKKEENEHRYIKASQIVYGGSNRQNISTFNAKINQSLLLSSYVPVIIKRKVKLPTKDFIYQCMTSKFVKDIFKSLHSIFDNDRNNVEIKTRIDNYFIQIIEYIAIKADEIRRDEVGWSERDAYKNLPAYQKIWLDGANQQCREEDDSWLDQIIEHITRVLIGYYNKNYGKDKIILGDEEHKHVMDLITKHKQVLYDKDNIN